MVGLAGKRPEKRDKEGSWFLSDVMMDEVSFCTLKTWSNKVYRLQPVTICDTWHNYLTLNKV